MARAMEKFTMQYDRKNAINTILGTLFVAVSGLLTFLVDKVRKDLPLQSTHIILLVICLGAYGGFICLRWFYYNSRVTGHLPVFSEQHLHKMVQDKIDEALE